MKEFLKKSGISFIAGITAFSLILPPQVFAEVITKEVQSEGTSANEPAFSIDLPNEQNEATSIESNVKIQKDALSNEADKSISLDDLDFLDEGGEQGSPNAVNDPPYSVVQPEASIKQIKPEVDLSSGALVYRYPLKLPPGRNGLTPELALVYNSQDRKDGSYVGYGWTLDIPFIIRENKYGQDRMYVAEDERFAFSIDGSLTLVTGNQFFPKNDSGALNENTHTF